MWGVWKNNTFYFETDPDSVKGRNLLSNNNLVVHVQDGNDTVIIHGTAKRVQDEEVLARLKKDYAMKYRYTPNWSNESDQMVFRVRPRVVHAWKAPRMHRSLVKFVF